MAITVNHSTPADNSFSATGATAWNANHSLVGVGTMAEQDANNVAITGGSISGVSGIGTVTSVDVSGGTTGLTTSGGPITSSGAITLAGTLALANGGTGATTAAQARSNLGASLVGANMFTLVSPSFVTFPRFNADNTVSALTAGTFRTAIGAGTVTSVAGTGTVNGLSLSGTVTTTGNLTLGGVLDLSSPPAIGNTAANSGKFTSLSATSGIGGGAF